MVVTVAPPMEVTVALPEITATVAPPEVTATINPLEALTVTKVPTEDIVKAPINMESQAMVDMVAIVNLLTVNTLSRDKHILADGITVSPLPDTVKTDTKVATTLKLTVATKTPMTRNTTTTLMVLVVFPVLRDNHLSMDFKVHMDRRNLPVLRDLNPAKLSMVAKVSKDIKISMV